MRSFFERQWSTMVDNMGSDIIYCTHEYYKMIVKHCHYCRLIQKNKAPCFLERQCLTMIDNRGSDIIYCTHDYNIVKHCQ